MTYQSKPLTHQEALAILQNGGYLQCAEGPQSQYLKGKTIHAEMKKDSEGQTIYIRSGQIILTVEDFLSGTWVEVRKCPACNGSGWTTTEPDNPDNH